MASLSLSGSAVQSPPSPSQAIPGFRRRSRKIVKLPCPGLSQTSLGFRFSSLIFPRKANLYEQKKMICLAAHLDPRTHLPTSTSRLLSKPLKRTNLHFPYEFMKSYALIRRTPTRFLTLVNNGNNDNNNSSSNGLRKDPFERERNGEKNGGLGSERGDGPGKENRRSVFNSIRWGELLLNPDPDNILAVGLTGLLTWASFQVLWQLFFISLAILVAAVKGLLRQKIEQRVFVAYASNSNPSGGDSIEEKSDGSTTSDAAAEGPPLLTILAGLLVFFVVFWIVGSITMWLIDLFFSLASPK